MSGWKRDTMAMYRIQIFNGAMLVDTSSYWSKKLDAQLRAQLLTSFGPSPRSNGAPSFVYELDPVAFAPENLVFRVDQVC